MGPRVEAACRFVERTGGEAVIGPLNELDAISRGEAGTLIAGAAALATA
jgi:carbamate kinase